jgi:hypothetical protein
MNAIDIIEAQCARYEATGSKGSTGATGHARDEATGSTGATYGDEDRDGDDELFSER